MWKKARDLVQHGEWAEAMSVFARILVMLPGDPRALYNKALAHWHSGDLTGAQSCLHELLQKNPDYEPAQRALSRLSKDVSEREDNPRLSVEQVVSATLGRVSSPRLFVKAEIPERHLRAAEEGYAGDTDGEQVLALFDDAYFGHGGRGLLLSEGRVAWMGGRQKTAASVDFRDIGAIALDNRSITVLTSTLEQHQIRLSRANRAEIEVIWFALRAIVKAVTPRVSVALRHLGSYRRAIAEATIETLRSSDINTGNTLFVAPDIPEAKVSIARQTFLRLEDGERLLALFDDTVLGNAKAGFFITDQRIAWSRGLDAGSVGMEDLQAAAGVGGRVTITAGSANSVVEMTLWSKCQVEGLATALNRVSEVNRSRKAGRVDAPTVLRSSSAKLLSVELDRLRPHISGTLTLREDALLWQPEGPDDKNWIKLENITTVRAQPFSQKIAIESEVGPAAVRFDVGQGAAAWVKAIENARSFRRMAGYFGEF